MTQAPEQMSLLDEDLQPTITVRPRRSAAWLAAEVAAYRASMDAAEKAQSQRERLGTLDELGQGDDDFDPIAALGSRGSTSVRALLEGMRQSIPKVDPYRLMGLSDTSPAPSFASTVIQPLMPNDIYRSSALDMAIESSRGVLGAGTQHPTALDMITGPVQSLINEWTAGSTALDMVTGSAKGLLGGTHYHSALEMAAESARGRFDSPLAEATARITSMAPRITFPTSPDWTKYSTYTRAAEAMGIVTGTSLLDVARSMNANGLLSTSVDMDTLLGPVSGLNAAALMGVTGVDTDPFGKTMAERWLDWQSYTSLGGSSGARQGIYDLLRNVPSLPWDDVDETDVVNAVTDDLDNALTAPDPQTLQRVLHDEQQGDYVSAHLHLWTSLDETLLALGFDAGTRARMAPLLAGTASTAVFLFWMLDHFTGGNVKAALEAKQSAKRVHGKVDEWARRD